MKQIILYLALIFSLINCKKTSTSACNDSDGLQQESNFPIGVAININEFKNNPTYKSIADKQFNSFTAENIFKAEYLHPEETIFDWTDADALSDFCLTSGKRLHGHTLIWQQQLPQWILNYSGSAADWEKLFKNHIETIVLHFKGKVTSWDVVNEAFNDDGTLKNNIWKQKIGDTYIEKAFTYAHDADPDVLLFYNDFSLESNPTKRNSIIHYFNNLRVRGVKIDGIGLQMHVSISSPEASQVAESLQDIVANNYKIHISELDISVNPLSQNIHPNQALFENQADYLGKIILNYKQVPSKFQYGITFWGVSDKDSWIPAYFNREDYPLLYDNNYLPKPAYCKLKEIL